MIIVNFKVVMTLVSGPDDMYGYLRFIGAIERPPNPFWLVAFTKALEGRAAATFVTLAGAGIGIMAARAIRTGRLASIRIRLLKRSLFLLAAGLAYITLWPGDILHYYGVYLALAVLFLAVSNRTLWFSAVLSVAAFLTMLVTLDYEKSWNWYTLDYADFWTPAGFARNTLFNGFHPVLPWIAFLFVGIWLGRRLADGQLNLKKVFWVGLVTAIVAETISRLIIRATKASAPSIDPEIAEALFGTASMPPSLFYMLGGGGTALGVICLSLGVAKRWPAAWWVKTPAATGRLALTFYVAHVVVGIGFLGAIGQLEGRTLTFSVACSAAFCGLSVLFALLWTRRFSRGPLEWLMRKLTG